MYNETVFLRIKSGTLPKLVFLMVIFVFLMIPQMVSGGTTGTAAITGNLLQSPVAQFTADIPVGTAPLPVGFTDMSEGVPTAWIWNFGDGTTSSIQNPTHTYASGIYTVNLTITNAAGTSTKIYENYITAYASKKTLTYGGDGLTGTDVASLNVSEFAAYGGTQSLSGNTLILDYPAGSAFQRMAITFDSVDNSQGNISGPVKSIILESAPITGTLPTTGETEKHTLKLYLNSVPLAGAEIRTTLIERADRESQNKFQAFALSNDLTLLNTMCELVVSTNLPTSSITGAEITMEVPVSWYTSYGSKVVRMMRIDNGGTVSILDTTFLGFDGPDAVYTGHSPHGLSTFAITALQGPSDISPSPWAVFWGGGDSDRISPQQAARENSPVQVPAPEQNPSVGGQRAPSQGSRVIRTIDLSPYSGFMYIDASGRPGAIIDQGLEPALAKRAGATISVSGKTIKIIHQDFTLTITAGTVTEVNGTIRAEKIQSIEFAATPVDANASGVGPVTSSFTADLASLPPDAALTITIGEPVTPLVTETFRRTVAGEGETLEATAYTLTVKKTNITTTLPAMITMSAPAEWVTSHGGINAIVIGRIADDQTCTILKTTFSGYDKRGNMEFVAKSPGGLSVFGLIATGRYLQAHMGQSGLMAPEQPAPVLLTMGTLSSIFHAIGGFGIVIPVIVIVVVIAGYIIWKSRRPLIGKARKQEKK